MKSLSFAWPYPIQRNSFQGFDPIDRPNEFDVEEIARLAQGGCQLSFRKLVEHFQASVFAQMTRFSHQRNTIEMLTHDTFVEAFLSLGSFKFKSPFEHWLRKIAVRVGYRFWQDESKQRRRKEAIPIALTENVEMPMHDKLTESEELQYVLGQLPPRDRLVLTLLYWDNLSIGQAAKVAGWSKTMTKVQAHRARQKLLRLLEKRK